MKLGKLVLLEILRQVQNGIVNGVDVSENLREIDVVQDPDNTDLVTLSNEYMTKEFHKLPLTQEK